MTFDEWYAKLPNAIPHGHEAQMRFAWDAALRASPSEAEGEALWEVIDALGALDRPWDLAGHGIEQKRAEEICELAQQWRRSSLSRSPVEGGRGGDNQQGEKT